MNLDLFIGVMLGITASAFYITQENPCEKQHSKTVSNISHHVSIDTRSGVRYWRYHSPVRYQF